MSTAKSVLSNFGYVLLNDKEKHFRFVKNREELERLKTGGEISDGDIVVELTQGKLWVANLMNYIELQ